MARVPSRRFVKVSAEGGRCSHCVSLVFSGGVRGLAEVSNFWWGLIRSYLGSLPLNRCPIFGCFGRANRWRFLVYLVV